MSLENLLLLLAYEYTSSVEIYDNYLHRNVIFRDTKNLPKKLFTRADSLNPEDLWDWMNGLRQNGVESLAIPHNSNISGGAAFPLTYYNGDPIDETYATNRANNEPLVEVTQAKGTSETHPCFQVTMNGQLLKFLLKKKQNF